MTNLSTLIEGLDGPSREVDCDVAVACGLFPMNAKRCRGGFIIGGQPKACPKFTASIDAALSLLPEGWAFGLGRGTDRSDVEGWAWCAPVDEGEIQTAATPCLALLSAIMKARGL